MEIKLHINDNGRPYLEFNTNTDELCRNSEDELLEFFISEARKKGIVIVNESSFDTLNNCASIRIKGDEECL